MHARHLIIPVAAVSASLGLVSFTHAAHAAPAAAKYANEAGYPAKTHECRCGRLPRPGLQADSQFYYDTPGYFPGFYPGAGMLPELGPRLGSGFSEGPLGPQAPLSVP
jgi:hypothetical protein